uniref:Uncharacterized protein n=2 Tax=Avena sativa TaxID=4498 RepID=A0ACD5YAQ9_AVESA
MAGLGTGAGAPVVKVYHEKSMILPDVSRVLACLYEKKVEFETVTDSYKDILRLQATRSVPVPFYDGPTFRQESRAICRYIAETYEQRGYPFLLGKDVLERASIEQWLRHEEHAFDPPSRALFCHLAFPLHDEDMSDIDREKRKLEEVLEVYEQRLGESEFLAGNKFTLADLVHLPNTHHIVTSEKFAYLYDSRKNVQRWWNTISARDSWQQVVRDMQIVEEQNQIEELEQQQQQQLEEQWQWETEPPPTSGRRILHIDPRQQTGTKSHTVLVAPPSGGAISSPSFTVQQEQQPLHTETTSHGETSPNNRKGSNFFTTTDKTPPPSKPKTSTTQKPPSSAEGSRSNFFTPATPPTTTKMSKRIDTDKSTSKDASSPTRPSQGLSKEAPDKPHLSGFYNASSHTEDTSNLAKPTPKEPSKTTDRISAPRQSSDVVKPSPESPRTPYKTERKPTSVDPSVDSPVPYTRPDDSQTQRSPYTSPAAQKPADTSGPEAGERPSNQRSVVQTPYTQQHSEQAKKATADQRAAPQLPEHAAAKDIQDEAAPEIRYRDGKDRTKEAREAQGEDEQFSTKRLRKMVEKSDPEVLKSQSTDLQTPPIQEETPSISKKPAYAQDRKGQAGNSSADAKTDGTPATGTRDPDTTTTADAMRAASPPYGGMAADGRGATEPRKSPSINEKQPAPPMPSQSPTSSAQGVSASSKGATQDDDLPKPTNDQWRDRSAPTTQEGASTDKLDKAADRRGQTDTPNKTSTDQSDKSGKQTPRPTTTTSDQPSDQDPPMPSFADRRNVKRGTDEASQTTKVAPDEQPAGRAPTNTVNKLISLKDNGKQTNETAYYSSSETSREMAPSGSEKSMGQQKMQSDKSSISPQANGKQGSQAALLTNTDQNSGKTPGQESQESQKQISPDTQQMKNNRSNSTTDSSSKPTQFDGNEGDVRETQRGG